MIENKEKNLLIYFYFFQWTFTHYNKKKKQKDMGTEVSVKNGCNVIV